MNRINRRSARLNAMQKTIVRLNSATKELGYSDPKRKEMNAQREYLAQQIAEASYTIYWARYYSLLTNSIQDKVKKLTDAYGYSMYLAEDIERLSKNCRGWCIANSRNIWLAD